MNSQCTLLLAGSLAIVAISVVCFVPSTASSQIAVPSATTTTAWEHLAMTHDGAEIGSSPELSARIIRLGEQGWELVDVSTIVKEGTTVKTVFYFKRPK